jgi:hypothetical protein
MEAFGLGPNGTGGQATISSSFWLLVRYANLPPKTFVCKGDRGTRPFDPNAYRTSGRRSPALWDFGPAPARHCSYSYHAPYGRYELTPFGDPAIPLAADRNPWIDGPRWKATDFTAFRRNGTVDEQRAGNTLAHWLDGQNVLFLDSHVDFEKRSFCGVDDDNLYTSWDGGDKVRGVPPKLGSMPADAKDSLLVNDPVQPSR